MSDLTIKEKQKEIEDFWKEAFCVDGPVNMVENKDFVIDVVVRLEDSKRGTFYIASLSKQDEMQSTNKEEE